MTSAARGIGIALGPILADHARYMAQQMEEAQLSDNDQITFFVGIDDNADMSPILTIYWATDPDLIPYGQTQIFVKTFAEFREWTRRNK